MPECVLVFWRALSRLQPFCKWSWLFAWFTAVMTAITTTAAAATTSATVAAATCLLVGCLTSQQHASVSQGQICTDNFTCCHTEIEKLQVKLSTSPSHTILTPGRPVPALTLYCQAPGRVATGVSKSR